VNVWYGFGADICISIYTFFSLKYTAALLSFLADLNREISNCERILEVRIDYTCLFEIAMILRFPRMSPYKLQNVLPCDLVGCVSVNFRAAYASVVLKI
jgi:hypothetical protein